MLDLQLGAEEAEMLLSILERDLGDLRMEIADTDQKDFRDDLKRQEEFMKLLIERLRAQHQAL